MTVSTSPPAATSAFHPPALAGERAGSALPRPHLPAWQLGRELSRDECCAIYQARPRRGPADCPADYAVKVCHTSRSAHRLTQFRREAWLGGHVQHQHLVPVFSARLTAELCYLVMPFLPGVNLARVLARAGRLSTGHAVWIARQTTEALAAIHQVGWLHGDVKPANLMLSREGHATLIDLGFAREAATTDGPEGPLLASVSYAAPEQFTADPAGGPADVYSLAVTLFEMLTGRLPYDGTTSEQLANAHLRHTPADVRDFEPLVPQPIAWLLRRAMAKVPLRRPSAGEMRDILAVSEIDLLNQWFATQ
jgi:eukaryotic-like serine/threonine-protein kinase